MRCLFMLTFFTQLSVQVTGQPTFPVELHSLHLKPNQAIHFNYFEIPVYDVYTFLNNGSVNKSSIDSLAENGRIMLDTLLNKIKGGCNCINIYYINKATNVVDGLLLRCLVENKEIKQVDTIYYDGSKKAVPFLLEKNQFIKYYETVKQAGYYRQLTVTTILPDEKINDDSLNLKSKIQFSKLSKYVSLYKPHIMRIIIRYITQYGMNVLGEFQYPIPYYYPRLFRNDSSNY